MASFTWQSSQAVLSVSLELCLVCRGHVSATEGENQTQRQKPTEKMTKLIGKDGERGCVGEFILTVGNQALSALLRVLIGCYEDN